MPPAPRDKRVNFQAAAAEVEMLRQLADHSGLSLSDYMRQVIRRDHAQTFGEPPVKAKPAKPKRKS